MASPGKDTRSVACFTLFASTALSICTPEDNSMTRIFHRFRKHRTDSPGFNFTCRSASGPPIYTLLSGSPTDCPPRPGFLFCCLFACHSLSLSHPPPVLPTVLCYVSCWRSAYVPPVCRLSSGVFYTHGITCLLIRSKLMRWSRPQFEPSKNEHL